MAHGRKTPTSTFGWFVQSEVGGSALLLGATLAALIWANSAWAEHYFALAHTYVGVSWGEATFKLSLQHWVNDALMVLFFFVVGLEIKRELVVGHLSALTLAALPAAAAAGGMIVPALIFVAINAGGPGGAGWGIPMATDIAFALGVLALFGKRVPIGLKIFLTALAIVDDIGAVLVIALFYTEQIRLVGLLIGAAFLALLFLAIRANLQRVGILAGLILGVWAGIFASGIHATVAGILLAFLVPVRARIQPERFFERVESSLADLRSRPMTRESMLADEAQLDSVSEIHTASARLRPAGLSLEHYLHPVQAFLVLPLFAFFNAGVTLDARVVDVIVTPVALGVMLGLVAGKIIGICGASWLVVRSGAASLPEGVTWGQVVGASALAGIGFTMSLFISDLAYPAAEMIGQAKIGILAGSLVAAMLGAILLSRSLPRRVA